MIKTNDQKARTAIVLLASAGALLICISIYFWWRRQRPNLRASDGALRPASVHSIARVFSWIAVIGIAVLVYLGGNVLLFRLGGHPFDFSNEKMYAYVARTYGPDQLYYLPNLISLPKFWHGIPYSESAFPYEPISAYFFSAIGWLGSLTLASGGVLGLSDVRLDYLIKGVNVLFGLADAALIYLILRVLSVSMRWSLISAGLFLFNPAVWFSMSVWGQNHVFSLFLVLMAVLLAEKGLPLWAWLTLVAACLTRPQIFVFGLILGIVFLRKFSWRQNLWAVSWTVILIFVVLAPLTLATSPSLPIDVALANVRNQQAGGNPAVFFPVSFDAYSIWPLVTYLAHGASGLLRMFTTSSTSLIGSVTYQGASQFLTLGAALFVCAAVLIRTSSTKRPGAYLPFVALGISSFLMLVTGSLATYFLLAIPFLLLSRPWMGTLAYFYVVIAWTITTLVPMFGDMGIVISSQDYPLLATAHNAVTRFFVQLYASDRFITIGVTANVCAVLWLAYSTFRRSSSPNLPPVAPS